MSMIFMLTGAELSAQNQGRASSPETDGPLFLFSMEMDEFVERATLLRSVATELPTPQIESKVEDLIEIASRMASIYFESLDTEHQTEIDQYLGYRLEQNSEIRTYFVLLGNQFVFGAESLVLRQAQNNKKYRMYATIGGSLLGAAAGGAVLYFKPNLVQGFWKSSLLVIGLGAAGAGVGYGSTYAFGEYILPAEPGLKTAKDFVERYPAGEDFISKIENLDVDLLMGMADVDDAISELEARDDD